MKTTVDYIIVGQGLAGSALIVQLLKRDKRILVIDEARENTSSRIAAGMFNPITGKFMTRTWKADALFPALHRHYAETETLTGGRFFFPMPLYRPFKSIEEQNEWMGRSVEPAYRPYVEAVVTQSQWPEVNNSFGGVMLRQCGYLDTAGYVDAVRDLVKRRCTMIETGFDEDALRIGEDGVEYHTYTASKIIFCQGVRSLTNRWFGAVPIRPLKGETITIKSSWQKDVIVNRGVYIVPGRGIGESRVGSTYDAEDAVCAITEKARLDLEQRLRDLVSFPYEVTGQDWGHRPTLPDRRPVLGGHPKYKPLVIFNGLGTKGVSLAPYFSEVLIQWLENGGTIDKEVNVTRFKLLY